MKEYGFVRVGACVPKLFLGNPMENAKEIVKIIKEAAKKEIGILSFPLGILVVIYFLVLVFYLLLYLLFLFF